MPIVVPIVSIRKIHFILLLLLATGLYKAQAQSLKHLIRQGEEAMTEKDYFSAAQYFNQVILIDSSETEYQYAYAEASRLNYDYDIALHWYLKVYKKDNARTYIETTFWIGTILKSKAKYKDAKKYFDKYYRKQRNSKDAYHKLLAGKAKQELESCDIAQILISKPVDVRVEHLDSTVNSRVSEYAPFEFDSVLYFSSLRDKSNEDENKVGYNKLYTSEKKDKAWQKAKELDSLFNKHGIHNANTSFNSNFTKIFVSRCQALNASQYRCAIYYSELKNGRWSELVRLPAPINTESGNTTQPCYSKLQGREALFFSSNRGGGEGGMDIWYSFMKADGSFEAPINAGKTVNSYEDEITPWFVEENQTLYFSSTWHKGLGGFDIFRSEYKNTAFGESENMGFPINSSYNDIYYSVNSQKDRAYISSNRLGSYFEEKQSCCNDIYSFKITPLSVPVKHTDTTTQLLDQMRVLVPLTLYFHNDEPDPKTKAITTKKNYKTTYEEYSMLRPRYVEEYTRGLNGDQRQLAENRITNFFEDSVDAGMRDLDRFLELLEQVLLRGEKVKITMKGYCSPLASTEYNIFLAKRRISSLRNYILEYRNGYFLKYINNPNPKEGAIEFFDEDIGELAVSKVSDDVKDVRNSVFSPYAAVERKIQIIAISTFTK